MGVKEPKVSFHRRNISSLSQISWKTLKAGLKPNIFGHPLVTKHSDDSSGGICVGACV